LICVSDSNPEFHFIISKNFKKLVLLLLINLRTQKFVLATLQEVRMEKIQD